MLLPEREMLSAHQMRARKRHDESSAAARVFGLLRHDHIGKAPGKQQQQVVGLALQQRIDRPNRQMNARHGLAMLQRASVYDELNDKYKLPQFVEQVMGPFRPALPQGRQPRRTHRRPVAAALDQRRRAGATRSAGMTTRVRRGPNPGHGAISCDSITAD
jgi:hypothetical protein